MSATYVIAAISNSGGAPEQAYRKMQSAGACPERPFAGKISRKLELSLHVTFFVLTPYFDRNV